MGTGKGTVVGTRTYAFGAHTRLTVTIHGHTRARAQARELVETH